MDTANPITTLIQDSFLSHENKEALRSHFSAHGSDEEFFSLFNTYLIEETDKRVNLFETSTEEYDAKCTELEQRYGQILSDLETNLEQALASTNKADVKKRNHLFDTYYSGLQKVQEEKRKDLMVLNAQQIYPFIQNTYQQ